MDMVVAITAATITVPIPNAAYLAAMHQGNIGMGMTVTTGTQGIAIITTANITMAMLAKRHTASAPYLAVRKQKHINITAKPITVIQTNVSRTNNVPYLAAGKPGNIPITADVIMDIPLAAKDTASVPFQAVKRSRDTDAESMRIKSALNKVSENLYLFEKQNSKNGFLNRYPCSVFPDHTVQAHAAAAHPL